ncbi:hypothetical protein JYT92_00180 [bacterium AH-315-L15]|nr:hypothetical protein [bacterium AH-315-L15]
MRSFSINQSISLINISQTLAKLQQDHVIQLSGHQKMTNEILSDFQKNGKKVKVITDDGKWYMAEVKGNSQEMVVLRLPDTLKIFLSNHLILVFSPGDKEYVLQGFIKKYAFPNVLLSYADPRLEKRWRLPQEETVFFSSVPKHMLEMLVNEELKVLRIEEMVSPASLPAGPDLIDDDDLSHSGVGSHGEGERVSREKEVHEDILTIEDHFCTNVIVESMEGTGQEDKGETFISNFQVEERFHESLNKEKITGKIFDITPSGIGILSKPDVQIGPQGGLVSIALPSFHVQVKDRPFEFQIRLFGIVLHKRSFEGSDDKIIGIKFVKRITDPRFREFLVNVGNADH